MPPRPPRQVPRRNAPSEHPPGPPQIRVVVDSNVFARTKWIGPIVDSARAGYTPLHWCPCIIAETSRLLARLWISRNEGDVSPPGWRRHADKAKAWFAVMTMLFHVVDDRPPYDPQWADPPPDEWDAPIWSAAVRANAHIIVTENLQDGPPPDEQGIRRFQGIWFMHPDFFVKLLEVWADLVTTRTLQTLEEDPSLAPLIATSEIRSSLVVAETETESEIPSGMRSFIDDLFKKQEAEQKHQDC